MKVLYFILSISFGILFLANFIWTIFNLYMFLVVGVDSVLTGETLIENIYYSEFLRWIILADVSWLIFLLVYVLKRKSYKTDSNLHYLQNSPIKERQICVIMPAFNEEMAIKQVVEDFQRQSDVKHVIVFVMIKIANSH